MLLFANLRDIVPVFMLAVFIPVFVGWSAGHFS